MTETTTNATHMLFVGDGFVEAKWCRCYGDEWGWEFRDVSDAIRWLNFDPPTKGKG